MVIKGFKVDGFQKYLCPCALDNNSLRIGRVNVFIIYLLLTCYCCLYFGDIFCDFYVTYTNFRIPRISLGKLKLQLWLVKNYFIQPCILYSE